MARIWYSVCGEGVGHATRSDSVMSMLGKHELLITAADKAYPYLKERYGDRVHQILGNTFAYKDNRVQRGRSAARFFWNLPRQVSVNTWRIMRLMRDFKPNLIISDFESSANYLSYLYRIPCINIDNIHALTELRLPLRKPCYITPMIKILHPPADFYIITNVAELPAKRANVMQVPPIVRKRVLDLKPEREDFVLVYQTSPTNVKMLPVFAKCKGRFKVYGMMPQKHTNAEFCSFDETRFLDDLRKCRFVIVNGGFTVISEALYLKKPILCIPIEKQFEQEFNAFTIRQQGYGSFTTELRLADMNDFEANLDRYQRNLNALERWDNTLLFERIQQIIAKHVP